MDMLYALKLALAFGTALVVGVVVMWGRWRWERRTAGRTRAREVELRAKVASKAARATEEQASRDEAELSDSGIFSVIEVMEALANGGNLPEAEKWALNAIHNNPARADVAIKLAEIYFRQGKKTKFLAMARNIIERRMDVSPQTRERLERMSAELIRDQTESATPRQPACPARPTLH